jgi:uncharacterized membrane protein
MMQSAHRVTGAVLWANHSLLFCLTLFPLMIRWIDDAGVSPWPVASFGLVLVGSAIAYQLLERALIAAEGDGSGMQRALGHGLKEWVSFASYVLAVPLAFVSPYISVAIYVAISIVWIIPDRRFERPACCGSPCWPGALSSPPRQLARRCSLRRRSSMLIRCPRGRR